MLLIGVALTISIFLAVLSVGIATTRSDLQYLLSRPRRLARSLLAMVVLGPIATVLVCKSFSLHPAVVVALVTLSVAPVGALFSQSMLPLVAPGRGAYAHGLFFSTTVLSVIVTPVAVELIQAIFGGDVHISPFAVGQVVLSSVLLPLGLGFAIGRWRPGSRQWIHTIKKASSLVLLVCLVAILAVAGPYLALVLRQGTVTAIALITLIGLAAGHYLGGPDEDDRTVLAFATVSRHPGVAMAVAGLTDQPLAPLGVLLAVIVGEVVVVPYKLWRKRRRLGGPAGRAPAAAD